MTTAPQSAPSFSQRFRESREVHLLAVLLALLPLVHPLLRPYLGPPSHLLWFAHVFPVALLAYLWGLPGAAASTAVSVLVVVAGEATFGAGYWVPADTATVASLGVSMGLTELLVVGFGLWARSLERERVDLEHLATTALDAAQEAVLLIDAGHRIQYANPVARQLFDGHVLRGHSCDRLVEEADELCGGLARGVAGRWQLVGHTTDGRRFPVEISASPIRDEEGVLTRWYLTARDRSQELRREETERRSRALRELGTVIAGIAHELNNPLTSVAAYAQLLEEDLGRLPPDVVETVDALAQEGQQAARIARRLLRQVRKGDVERVPLDLNEVVQRAVRTRERQFAAHGIVATTALADGPLPVTGNASALQEVIVNLITNAEQAMHEAHGGGRLVVATVRRDRAAELAVEDDGPGIEPALLERIFEPFFTTKGDGGTGIGLAMARRIAERHGGELKAANRPAGGARFTLVLPLGHAAQAPAAVEGTERDAHATPATPSRARVLLVDDQPHIRRSLARLLTRRGYPTVAAGSVAEALGLLAARDVDVVLSDVHMPGASGFELYQALQENGRPRLAFVLMTGDVLGPEVEQFLRATGCPHVAKPFEVEDVIAALQRAVGGRAEGSWRARGPQASMITHPTT